MCSFFTEDLLIFCFRQWLLNPLFTLSSKQPRQLHFSQICCVVRFCKFFLHLPSLVSLWYLMVSMKTMEGTLPLHHVSCSHISENSGQNRTDVIQHKGTGSANFSDRDHQYCCARFFDWQKICHGIPSALKKYNRL